MKSHPSPRHSIILKWLMGWLTSAQFLDSSFYIFGSVFMKCESKFEVFLPNINTWTPWLRHVQYLPTGLTESRVTNMCPCEPGSRQGVFYLHTLGGHAGRLVKDLKLVPARREGVVTDEVLQGWLLQPTGAEGGAAVGVLEDGVATWCTLWREHCKKDKKIQTLHEQNWLQGNRMWKAERTKRATRGHD